MAIPRGAPPPSIALGEAEGEGETSCRDCLQGLAEEIEGEEGLKPLGGEHRLKRGWPDWRPRPASRMGSSALGLSLSPSNPLLHSLLPPQLIPSCGSGGTLVNRRLGGRGAGFGLVIIPFTNLTLSL